MPKRLRPANVLLVTAFPCDRETNHLFFRLQKIFTDAHWKVTSEGGWPIKTVQLGGRTKNQLPIGIWILSDDQYERYLIWDSLRDSGLDSDSTFTGRDLPDNYKGLIVVVGYKDVPF